MWEVATILRLWQLLAEVHVFVWYLLVLALAVYNLRYGTRLSRIDGIVPPDKIPRYGHHYGSCSYQ